MHLCIILHGLLHHTHVVSYFHESGRKSAKTTFHRQVSVSTFAGAVGCLCSPRYNVVAPSRYAARKTFYHRYTSKRRLFWFLRSSDSVFQPVPCLLNSYSWCEMMAWPQTHQQWSRYPTTTTVLIREYKYLKRGEDASWSLARRLEFTKSGSTKRYTEEDKSKFDLFRLIKTLNEIW